MRNTTTMMLNLTIALADATVRGAEACVRFQSADWTEARFLQERSWAKEARDEVRFEALKTVWLER